MNTILDGLKSYFQNNSKEQIEKDWSESDKYDEIGPTIDEFLHQYHFFYELEIKDPVWEFNCKNQIIENPKFASDFFLT